MDECAVCFDSIGATNCTITKCGHKFCFQCIGKVILQNNNTCPLCRESLIDDVNILHEDEYDSDMESIDDDNITIINIREGNVEYIMSRFKDAGYSETDLMSLYIDRFEPSDTLSIPDQIWKLTKMRRLIQEVEDENDKETYENNEMSNEDTNAIVEPVNVSHAENMDIFKDLSSSLHNLNLECISREEIDNIRSYLNLLDTHY